MLNLYGPSLLKAARGPILEIFIKNIDPFFVYIHEAEIPIRPLFKIKTSD
jgi:hypothetical protein